MPRYCIVMRIQVQEAQSLRAKGLHRRAVPLLERAENILESSMGPGNLMAQGEVAFSSSLFSVLPVFFTFFLFFLWLDVTIIEETSHHTGGSSFVHQAM
jgi:hypothetical protein